MRAARGNAGAIVRVDSSISGTGTVSYNNSLALANRLRLNGDNSGYAGTGVTCTDNNECSLNTHNCDMDGVNDDVVVVGAVHDG